MNNEILQRLTALETAVGKLQKAIGGIVTVIECAAIEPAYCGKCSVTLTPGVTCANEECPCGLYKE